jgi:hypothetical protein
MIARGDNEDRTQKLLDRISVKESSDKGNIIFKTIFDSDSESNKGKNNFEINYTVSMPKGNPLALQNSFGDVYVAELTGPVNIDVKYGSLKTDKLTHPDNLVKVGFGSGDMAYMKSGKLKVSYSKLNLGGSEDLDIDNSFSDIVVGNSRNMKLQSKYGSVKLDRVNSLNGSIGFSGFNLARLEDNINLKVKYCSNFKIDEISNNFQSIDLDGSFSTFDLNFAGNSAFSFDTNMKFGDLTVNKDLVSYDLVENKNTSNSYRGVYGKKPGRSNVRIDASYSNVKFRNAE